ncbi:hypothetical protein LTS07_002263 [Exophiala sideris]|uniref:Xylanolytic transcriptional activator regulatory domain-containing protein n=1 Tax=Exophiala sideris TaxID=1016849 RepID=A0ABR0JMB5_9EURO|nr:hypothetical protein LTS07_002263 [Exophiala sideris]KAK5041635.1 hypothetical protein LTR13_002302 [Exophiala sideris]KAK5066919.1 hypothetical protein LTR69_002267 [Exophiala sideris]KAK5184978.1 hypothetical protein LTR44_002824 [Eurotiomycetes sp. CCFEE 6388]
MSPAKDAMQQGSAPVLDLPEESLALYLPADKGNHTLAVPETEGQAEPVNVVPASGVDNANGTAASDTPELQAGPSFVLGTPTPLPTGLDACTGGLVDRFFEKIQPVPSFSFLHPRMTKEKFSEGSLDETLILAICGVTISQEKLDPTHRDRSLALMSRSEELVWQRLDSPNMARLQALIVCVAYRIEMGLTQRAFMLAGLAARAVTAMRLNHERHDLDPVSNEVRRRTLWSLKILELYFSIGLPEYELLPLENVYLQLPCREESFQDSAPSLAMESGAYSHYVKLTSIRRDIMKLTRAISMYDQPFPQLVKLIDSLDHELNHLRCQMTSDCAIPFPSVVRFASTPWLARHLVMQLSWHQCRCDLYRLLLPDYPEAPPAVVLAGLEVQTVENAVRLCLEHSLAIIETLSDLNSQCAQLPLLEYDTAICGYHACRLVLFLAHSQPRLSQLSREYAISRAELCLTAIKRFFRFSMPVRPILRDLERLISTCSTDAVNWTALVFRSTPDDEQSRDPLLSAAARAKQRLAIHSLLRQADFEDSEPQAAVSPSNAGTGHSPVRQRNMYKVLSLEHTSGKRPATEPVSATQVGGEDQHRGLWNDDPGAFSAQPALLFPWCEPYDAFADIL